MNLNKKHRTELVRGLASAALLIGLLIGIPILLITGVGWPLPQELPSITKTLSGLKSGTISSSLILKSISCILWILWFQMLAGVVVELWSHFHGRVAPQVIFIPKFIQRLSARIIGAALVIIFSVQHPGITAADNQSLLAPTTIELDVEQSWTFIFDDLDNFATPRNEENSTNSDPNNDLVEFIPLIHTVQQRDSLQLLAEQYLGDPNRWTEVFVLNHGQTQAVGGSLTDPARLQPGWELIMPADAHRPISVESSIESPTDDIEITVQSGDTLRSLATYYLDDSEEWVTIFNSNKNIIQDPNIIVPGWQLRIPIPNSKIEIPLLTDSLIELPEELIDHTIPVMAYTTVKPAVVTASTNIDEQSAPTTQAILVVGGLGLFSSSLIWILAQIRRTRSRRLPNQRVPVPYASEDTQLEQQLQDISDSNSAIFLDAVLRVMSSRITEYPPPQIIGVSLNSDNISILLSTPAEVPYGFVANEHNTIWTLSKNITLEHLLAEAEGISAPLPTLVAIGKEANNEFLLNLEHIASFSLKGDSEAIKNLCSAMAIQLASSHLADTLSIICINFDKDLSEFDRVEHVYDVTSAIEKIIYKQRQNQALLGDNFSIIETRIGNNYNYLYPIVVLIPSQLTEEESYHLLEVCGPSVCIVGHELNGAAWTGIFDNSDLLLEPIGLRLRPYSLSDDTVSAVTDMVASIKNVHSTMWETLSVSQKVELKNPTSVLEQLSPEQLPFEQLPSEQLSLEQLPAGIEVRVMGTVEVLGAVQPFTSRRALDLVVYLAFHPEGADRDQLRTHIWPPDNPPSESTFANTISRARKALGVNSNGEPYLPRVSSKGIYRLRPEIRTDVDQFEGLVTAAQSNTGEQGTRQLQAAFELVRGTPFTGGAGDLYRWADFGLRTHIDCMVDTAAHKLAERYMDSGNPEGARKAAMASLRLVGICEQCYRWRLIAAAGNPTEVRQVMAELMGLLRRESNQAEINNLISPDLLELYKRLISPHAVLNKSDDWYNFE